VLNFEQTKNNTSGLVVLMAIFGPKQRTSYNDENKFEH
jgi:hypothetical protein